MIERLLILYGEPETDSPAAYLKEVKAAIEGYSAHIQDAACTLIRNTMKGRQFPTPAACRKACQDVCEERGQEAQRKPLPEINPAWSKAAIAKADSLIQGQLGQRAADEGWVLGLHDFCRNKGRLPVNSEIGTIMANAKEFDNAYRQAQEIGMSLVKLGNSMLARRDRCARVTDGEVLP